MQEKVMQMQENALLGTATVKANTHDDDDDSDTDAVSQSDESAIENILKSPQERKKATANILKV